MNAKKSDKQLWVRITALALAGLMLLGVIFTAVTAMG